jgi:HJR/Mrr/RecB family endonuclease
MTRNLKNDAAKKSILIFAFAVGGASAAMLYRFFEPYLPWLRAHKPALATIIAAVLALVVYFLLRPGKIASSLKEIDAMTGHEFERFLAKLFQRMGYRALVVGASGSDFGADLVIEKGGVKIAVQAKNYDRGRVGNDAVQQAIAGATYYDCKAAMVVTNVSYTKAALMQAQGCSLFPVTLWNRTDLEAVLSRRGARPH